MIHTEQRSWTAEGNWSEPTGALPAEPQLVLVFGDRELVARAELFQQIKQMYPEAYILIGSTAGNILDTEVSENSVTISALHFEKTTISFSETAVKNKYDSKMVGKRLAEFLPTKNLVHSIVLSDGLSLNGSDLARSINEHLPDTVTVTGGLVGDGEQFAETVVGCSAVPKSDRVVLIGFYSTDLRVGYASKGGWTASDHNFTITKSDGNTLCELDGRPALDVYEELLGDDASGLPGSALAFPLQLELSDEGRVVRTILSVDKEARTMTFAGDMPEGMTAHLMHASKDDLIASAKVAAEESLTALGQHKPQFAMLVSCIGRRLFLAERTSEEVAVIRDSLGEQAALHGFYSYGELCPAADSNKCLLHNQTMTITTFYET